MPVYNGERYVETAVRSLLNQTEGRFTLLISDDGSTDHTPEICARLAEEDSRIRFERQSNRLGLTGNFHYVARNQVTPYFMWAAQDDQWEPSFLAHAYRLLGSCPDALGAMTSVAFVSETGGSLGTHRFSDALMDGDALIRARSVLHERGYHAIYALYRRKLLPRRVELEDCFGQDLAYVFALSLYGRFVLSDEVLSIRRLMGYDTVRDVGGRLIWQKALGPSGHLYSQKPYSMCRHMFRYTATSPIPVAEKIVLLAEICREFGLRARRVAMYDTYSRAQLALRQRRFASACGLAVAATILDPTRAWRAATRRLSEFRGKA